MRQLLILALLPFTLAGVTSGQEAGLPSCNAAQLAATDEYMIEIYELMGVAMTPEMVAALSPAVYAEFGDLVTNETSSQTLSAYGEALFAWRKSFWEAHPICDEVFDIGLAIDESASDMAAFLAFQLAGVAPEDNPYVESMKNGIGLFFILLNELPDQPTADGDPSEVDLRACRDDDLEILSQELAVYRALLEVPPRTYSLVGLAKYGVAQLTWRDKLWTRLPPCELSLQVGLLMSHIISDLAIELALEIGVIASEDAPFSDQIAADRARLAKISAPIDAVDKKRAQTVTLPECDYEDIVRFSAQNANFPGLVEALKAAETAPDLLEVADLHLAWRETLEANLPDCIQSMITVGLMLRVTSNYIASMALDIAGVMPEPDAEIPIKPHLLGIVTIGAIADDISASIENSGMTPAELMEIAAAGSKLPDCDDDVGLGLNFYNLFVEYGDLVDIADGLETVGDVLDFRKSQIEWAENHIDRLPGCKEAIKAGYIMYMILADFTAAYALLIAGADVADIPYAETIWTYRDRLDAWLRHALQ